MVYCVWCYPLEHIGKHEVSSNDGKCSVCSRQGIVYEVKGMYLIQIGRYKNKYTTKYSTEKESQAYILYKAINIGNGYKKRLVYNGKTVLRYIS